MALWRDRVARQHLLLVLDDTAGSDQVRPLLPGSGSSLVLVTSRRHLTALEDARSVSLDTLSPRDAAELLVRLAARPGLDPRDAARSVSLPQSSGPLVGKERYVRGSLLGGIAAMPARFDVVVQRCPPVG